MTKRRGSAFIKPDGSIALRPKLGVGGGPFEWAGFCNGLARAGGGYIDKTGKQIIGDLHRVTRPFSDGRAVVGTSYTNLGYIDKTGKWSVPSVLHGAAPFRGGLAMVFPDGKRYSVGGYIDKRGRWVWQPSKRFDKRFDDLRRMTPGDAAT